MTEKEILKNYKHGDSFTALLSGDEIKCTGKITFQDGIVYFCQNETSGNRCKDLQGYRNSYQYSNYIKDLIITPSEKVVNNNYPIF